MAKIKFKAYHGTDESVAQAIVENGFISRPNREHWLGEGIYFFLDNRQSGDGSMIELKKT